MLRTASALKRIGVRVGSAECTMSGNEKRFDKALVIFVDILGSQSRDDFNELFKINELFHSELLGNKSQDREYATYQRHIYTFSDCAYIIYDYRNKSTSNVDFI